MTEMHKAVILARGLGTRMRKADGAVELSAAEAAAADAGIKAMIPIDRPFLDYVLSALADAGYTGACLVVAPDSSAIRDYYARLEVSRIRIEYAVQDEPLGTADAVLAAEPFADGQPILVINSDNYYPVDALRGLRRDMDGNGLAAFESKSMIEGSNISADRISKFAVVQIGAGGRLVRIIEKPSPQEIASVGEPVCLSMNCWRFGPAIFQACRSIQPSPRGELELPDAVKHAMKKLHEPFSVLTFRAPVLDMSHRSDIAGVKTRLAGTRVRL